DILDWRLVTRSAVVASPAIAASLVMPVAVAVGHQVPVVLAFDVRDVQEPVASHAEVDECRLNARLDIDDPALVDVPDVVLEARPLNIEFFENPILDDCDATLFGLEDVDQHFLLHVKPFVDRRTTSAAAAAVSAGRSSTGRASLGARLAGALGRRRRAVDLDVIRMVCVRRGWTPRVRWLNSPCARYRATSENPLGCDFLKFSPQVTFN